MLLLLIYVQHDITVQRALKTVAHINLIVNYLENDMAMHRGEDPFRGAQLPQLNANVITMEDDDGHERDLPLP